MRRGVDLWSVTRLEAGPTTEVHPAAQVGQAGSVARDGFVLAERQTGMIGVRERVAVERAELPLDDDEVVLT
jgi:hypothetical protein